MKRKYKIINDRIESEDASIDLTHYHSVIITKDGLFIWGSNEVRIAPQKEECEPLFNELKEYFQQRRPLLLKPLDPFWNQATMVELSDPFDKQRKSTHETIESADSAPPNSLMDRINKAKAQNEQNLADLRARKQK